MLNLTKKQLLHAAKKIEADIGCDPAINLKGDEDSLRTALIEAIDIVEESDTLDAETWTVINAIRDYQNGPKDDTDAEPVEEAEEAEEAEEVAPKTKAKSKTKTKVAPEKKAPKEPKPKAEPKPKKKVFKRPAAIALTIQKYAGKTVEAEVIVKESADLYSEKTGKGINLMESRNMLSPVRIVLEALDFISSEGSAITVSKDI